MVKFPSRSLAIAAFFAIGLAFFARFTPFAQGVADLRAVDLPELSSAMADLAEPVLAATVYLRVDQFDDEAAHADGQSGQGSGFVLDAAKGIIGTNAHVAGSTSSMVRVTFNDGRVCDGIVVGSDPQFDLAIVKVEPGFAKAQLKWGNSDALRPGDFVLAVGNPFGLKGTVSFGMVSALGRRLDMREDSYESYVQFDAFIAPGSSGGPLVNMHGELIGVNTAIGGQTGSWEGISYAVPAAMARGVMSALTSGKPMQRAKLGVAVRDVDAKFARLVDLDPPRGARVSKLNVDSPAEKAGIEVGDIILSLDGVAITDSAHLRARIGALRPETTIELEIWRDEEIRVLRVDLSVSE